MGYSWYTLDRLLNEIQAEVGMDVGNGNGAEVNAALGKKYFEHRKTPFPITNPEYIYRALVLKLRGKSKKSRDIAMNAGNLEILVHALGYNSYVDFLEAQHPSISADLKGCEGFWYSYARCNSEQPYIMRAPVQITADFRDVKMVLQESTRTFEGKMKLEGDCINCLLESSDTKNLHLVFKRGLESEPDVLQGVFSGLSTGNEPIAGREILVRQPEVSDVNELTHERFPIDQLFKAETLDLKIIAHYFNSKEDNILKAGQSCDYDITDLIKY